MIILLRNFDFQRELLKKGRWRESKFIGEELKNKIVGLVGCGAIGKSLAQKLQSFQVKKILGYDPYIEKKALIGHHIKKCSLNYLLKNSDIVSLHLPLTIKTKGLINLDKLKMMKSISHLINTSRGEIINEKELIFALKKKIIKAAALDVFENEPKIRKQFLSLKNLVATPHLAGYTHYSVQAMSLSPVKTFLAILNEDC